MNENNVARTNGNRTRDHARAVLGDPKRDGHRALAAWHLYQCARPAGAPDWDALTPQQQARVSAAVSIGLASLNSRAFLAKARQS